MHLDLSQEEMDVTDTSEFHTEIKQWSMVHALCSTFTI